MPDINLRKCIVAYEVQFDTGVPPEYVVLHQGTVKECQNFVNNMAEDLPIAVHRKEPVRGINLVFMDGLMN